MSELPAHRYLLAEADHEQGDRRGIEDMDVRIHSITDTQSQHPQNDQYNGYGPQHFVLLADFFNMSF
jgi:hypothetical protein